jgi:transposase-like protein
MTRQHIEVITSVERRRRWSREEKERLVAACLEPGASVSEIARKAGIHAVQLFRWRNQSAIVIKPENSILRRSEVRVQFKTAEALLCSFASSLVMTLSFPVLTTKAHA